jgi:hypothetical protein
MGNTRKYKIAARRANAPKKSKLILIGKSRARLQAAMEYLMTYGWAILIIAIVLTTLFQLGVFNYTNFAPRAPPGSCRVFRPGGPNTVSNINFEGICSGQLPQYVAILNGPASQSTIPIVPSMLPSSLTMSAWVYISSSNTCFSSCSLNFFSLGSVRLFKDSDQCSTGQSSSNIEFAFEVWNGLPAPPWDGYNFNDVCGNNAGGWYNLIGTFSSSTGGSQLYINGVQVNSQSIIPPLNYGGPTTAIISANSGGIFQIANIQLYNTSLSVSDIKTIYTKGIGGVPPFLRNLVGWWPLNGDANDYSGNNNNGASSGISYTKYTPP